MVTLREMKIRFYYYLIWTVAALPLSQNATSESLSPQDVQPHLKALATVQKFQQTISQRPCPAEAVDSAQNSAAALKFESFAKTQNCSELLSSDPPTWVSTSANAGIFKDPANWRPACSPYEVEWLIRKNIPSDRAVILAPLEAATLIHDSCINTASDRYGGSFKEPSQESSHVQPMGPEARVKLTEGFEWEKYRLSKACCGSDETCQILIRSVTLRFCKLKDDPKAPDPCVANGTYYTLGNWDDKSRWLAKLKSGASLSDLKGQFPVAAGEITMSPLEDTETHQPYFGANLTGLRHELGHACSRIKRDLFISQGVPEAARDLLSFKDCTINSDRSKLYKTLNDGLGISQETASCLEANAKGAKNARFKKQGSCKNGCESSYIEESLANVLALIQMDPSEIASRLIPDLCNAARDSVHGLASDDLRCALNTPSLRNKIEDGIACVK